VNESASACHASQLIAAEIKITLGTYGDLSPGEDEKTARAVSDFF